MHYILKYINYKFVWPLVSRLPYKIGYPIAVFFDQRFKRNLDHKTAFQNGLTNFAQQTQRSVEPELAWEKHLKTHSRERLDAYRLQYLNKEDIAGQVQLSGEDEAKEALEGGQGAILIMAHYGRPVMLCSALAHTGCKIGMLTGSVKDNPNLDSVDLWFHHLGMKNTLKHSKGHWFTTRDDLRGLYKSLKQGEIIIMMMDLPAGDNGIFVPFDSGHLKLPPGIVRIAKKTGTKLLFGSAQETENGHVHAKIFRLSDDPKVALEEATQHLFDEITLDPSQWWQWNLWPHLFKPNETECTKSNL